MHDEHFPPGSPGAPGLSKELAELAGLAGVALHWSDQSGQPQSLSREVLLRVLEALGHPCDGPQAIASSIAALSAAHGAPTMLTVRVGEPLALPLPSGLPADGLRASLRLESGETRELLPALREADPPGGAPTLSFDGFDTPGYHRLELVGTDAGRSITVAVAPVPACFMVLVSASWISR